MDYNLLSLSLAVKIIQSICFLLLKDIEEKELMTLLKKLNGVLLPGFDDDTGNGGYYNRVRQILSFSKKLKQRSKVKFPVLGIARGAERMLEYISRQDSFVDADAINVSLPIKWKSKVKRSRMFGKAPIGLINSASRQPIGFFHSSQCIPFPTYENSTILKKKVRVLSTNVDRNGTEFVSAFEGKQIFCVLARFFFVLNQI